MPLEELRRHPVALAHDDAGEAGADQDLAAVLVLGQEALLPVTVELLRADDVVDLKEKSRSRVQDRISVKY